MILHDPDEHDPDGKPKRGSMELGRWPWGWNLERYLLCALGEMKHGTSDELVIGFRTARALASHPQTREVALRLHGPYWPAETLKGFLLQHEALIRTARCTCTCPMHSEYAPNHQPQPHES